MTNRMLGLGHGRRGTRLVAWSAALGLLGLVGCGDDGGADGTIGERYAGSVSLFEDVICACYGELGFGSRGACIDATGFADPDRRLCLSTTIDEIDGTDVVYECLLDANEAYAACIESGGCAEASACETSFVAATERCPTLSAAVRQTFNSTLSECIGGEVTPGTCPEIMSNAGIGESITGSTTGLADDYAFAGADQCVAHGSGAPDVTVLWTVPADGDYALRFNAANTTFRAVLLQIAGCEDLAVQACADGTNFAGFTFTGATAGATATFLIDGFSSIESGEFQIDITEPPPM